MQTKKKIFDFSFNPFNENCIATGGQDGVIKLWQMPKDGLTEELTTAAVLALFCSPTSVLTNRAVVCR